MRRSKHKTVRRHVGFYTVAYGFRQPYKVLLDGNIVHVSREMKVADLRERVAALLGGQCRCFVTKCVMHELRSLGAPFREAHEAARQIELFKCGHDDSPLSPADCMLAHIGATNKGHLWVGTQDRDLREVLKGIPGAPSMFLTVNGLQLEEPSAVHLATAKREEDRHMGVGEAERGRGILTDLKPERIATSAKFRKGRAKGPNPLSVQKKKTKKKGGSGAAAAKAASGAAAGRDGGGAGECATEGGPKKRRRNRKHGGKAKGGDAGGT